MNFNQILEKKIKYYGKTEAAYEFAAEEYAHELLKELQSQSKTIANDNLKNKNLIINTEREIKVRDAIKYCIENFDSQTATNRIVEFWKDELKIQEQQCNIPVIICSADEAITLFNFYPEKSCENIKVQLVPVRKEYLEQYKTMESWLKTRHKHYK